VRNTALPFNDTHGVCWLSLCVQHECRRPFTTSKERKNHRPRGGLNRSAQPAFEHVGEDGCVVSCVHITHERAHAKTRPNLLDVPAGLTLVWMGCRLYHRHCRATNTASSASPALAAATAVRCCAMHDRQPREKTEAEFFSRIFSSDRYTAVVCRT